MTTGICRSLECSNGRDGVRVDRYPGPGEYCPECGNLLEEAPPEAAASTPSPAAAVLPYGANGTTSSSASAPRPAANVPPPAASAAPPAASATTAVATTTIPTVSATIPAANAAPAVAAGVVRAEPPPAAEAQPRRLTPLEELQLLESLQAAVEPPAAPGPPRRAIIATVGVLAAVVAAVAVIRPLAFGGPGGVVHVCRSSMTERFASDVIRAYAEHSRTPASRFALSTANCDVRFATARARSAAGLIGHDGVVVVVNPQNPLMQLSEQQLRMVFTGEITDWAELGGRPGRIEPVMTAGTSDEAQAIMAGLLRDRDLAHNVRRVPSSADVVRAVTSGRGRGSIGLVAFSAAVPGKVLKLEALPAPSVLSIGEHRYPLTLTVTVAADHAPRGSSTAALLQFARSDAAQSIAMRDGIIPRKGF